MEANDFVARLKANGNEKDLCDLEKVICEHKAILSKLPAKDRSSFCLNVLCILCRNIDKVPTWRNSIDPKLLLTLSIDCVRETRNMERPDRVKTLACIYHIQRFIIRLKSPMPPELVLKISFMPFECDVTNMLTEYAKTYWSILVDRLSYIEVLKAGKVAIAKLLPKLTEDILKVIQIYDTAQFCTNALTFLIKKLHSLYNDRYSNDLNKIFGQIFDSFTSKNDLKNFKKLSDKEIIDLYVKLNDCFYVIVENSSKNCFKYNILTDVVRTYISLLGHRPEIFHCFQTFYSNAFCNIFTNMTNPNYNETVFNSLLLSFETTEKLGYSKMMYVTYPFVNQLLRLYIDYIVVNNMKWSEIFTEQTEEYFLKIILLIMKKSKSTEQFLKCDNCKVKSGLHDALRLSFLSINFIKQSTTIENLLPIFNQVIEHQHATLKELATLGCCNYEKCYRKLQTDIHNTAIVLNKSKNYEYSIKLFNIYLENEIQSFKDNSDLKNISRALYNKSICELDSKNFEDALKNAFLSLIFAWPEGLNSDKYMSLVMDIKAKALKACDDEESQDKLQLVSVLDACKICLEEKWYGNLKPFFAPLKFSELLKHEFSMYAKLWPSISPIAGVWKSLYELVNSQYNWIAAENEDTVLSALYDTILETSSVVRTINSHYYRDVLVELVDMFDKAPAENTELQVIQASLLLLKAEFDVHEASEKYQWKITEPSMDPDQTPVTRTISQEFEATRRAIQAVDLLTDTLSDIKTVPNTKRLHICLELAEIFVQQLLHLHRQTHGLQLAYICCVLAERLDNKLSYVRNAGVLVSHIDRQTHVLLNIVTKAGKYCAELLRERNTVDAALVFVSDAAIHYTRCGAVGTAARLVQFAQTQILNAYEKYQDVNLELAVGRLMEAQCMLCRDSGPSTLSAVNSTQRHYLAVSNTASTRHARRLLSLTIKLRISTTSLQSVRLTRALSLYRRARSACAVAVPSSGAVALAALCARISNVHDMNDAQVKIDNRLKYILGIETSGAQSIPKAPITKTEIYTPKQELETMLENITFKKTQVSPSLPCISIPGFKTPEFLKHSICDCYACVIPQCYILTAHTVALEAAMYFRAKEIVIAKNYFEGALLCFRLAEQKLLKFSDGCEKFIVDVVKSGFMKEFKSYEVEMLIDASFFELSLNNYEKADEYVVKIHEIIQDFDVDVYLKNEILNLMVTSAELRKIVKKHVDTSLVNEFENLRLSPTKDDEPPKTPEIKAKVPPKIPKVIVKDEELPKKRKVIKLNLDEVTDEKEAPKKKTEFKIPVPKTSKHLLENITPRNTRSKPNILVTQSSDDIKTPMNEFFTPVASTPDQFFTPMSNLKTYSKKSLRHNIVKNLENEFSTPKAEFSGRKTLEIPKTGKEMPKCDSEVTKIDKLPKLAKQLPKKDEEMPKAGRSTVKDKNTLKRATSPGKLVKDAPTRSTRRQPVKFKISEDK